MNLKINISWSRVDRSLTSEAKESSWQAKFGLEVVLGVSLLVALARWFGN